MKCLSIAMQRDFILFVVLLLLLFLWDDGADENWPHNLQLMIEDILEHTEDAAFPDTASNTIITNVTARRPLLTEQLDEDVTQESDDEKRVADQGRNY